MTHPGTAWHNKMELIVLALADIDQELTTVGTALQQHSVLTDLAARALQAKPDYETAKAELEAAHESQQAAQNGTYQDPIIDPNHPSLLSAQEEIESAGNKLDESASDYEAVGGMLELESPLIGLAGDTLNQALTTMQGLGAAIQAIREAATAGQQGTASY